MNTSITPAVDQLKGAISELQQVIADPGASPAVKQHAAQAIANIQAAGRVVTAIQQQPAGAVTANGQQLKPGTYVSAQATAGIAAGALVLGGLAGAWLGSSSAKKKQAREGTKENPVRLPPPKAGGNAINVTGVDEYGQKVFYTGNPDIPWNPLMGQAWTIDANDAGPLITELRREFKGYVKDIKAERMGR